MAWIIPVALGLAGLVGQNVQNKAAQKNNDNQQAAAEQNAQQNYAQAQQNLANWFKSNPSPFSGLQLGAAPGGPQPGYSIAQQVMGVGPNGYVGAPQQVPGTGIPPGLIQRIMNYGLPPPASSAQRSMLPGPRSVNAQSLRLPVVPNLSTLHPPLQY